MAAILTRSCPLWVKSRHCIRSASCPLYPQKRTLELNRVMSALCQKRTLLVVVVIRLRLPLCSGPQQQPENHCMRDQQWRHDKSRNVKRRAEGCRIDTSADLALVKCVK